MVPRWDERVIRRAPSLDVAIHPAFHIDYIECLNGADPAHDDRKILRFGRRLLR
jgi:hypothetical protein